MKAKNVNGRQAGFTLPELLAAGVVLLIFIGVMLLLVRPANYDVERRNASRRLDLAVIMLAISDYKKYEGKLPPSITSEEKQIATNEDDSPNLCNDLVPKYLVDIPHDPSASLKTIEDKSCAEPDQFYVSGYSVRLDSDGRIVLSAVAAEKGETVTVERVFPFL